MGALKGLWIECFPNAPLFQKVLHSCCFDNCTSDFRQSLHQCLCWTCKSAKLRRALLSVLEWSKEKDLLRYVDVLEAQRLKHTISGMSNSFRLPNSCCWYFLTQSTNSNSSCGPKVRFQARICSYNLSQMIFEHVLLGNKKAIINQIDIFLPWKKSMGTMCKFKGKCNLLQKELRYVLVLVLVQPFDPLFLDHFSWIHVFESTKSLLSVILVFLHFRLILTL